MQYSSDFGEAHNSCITEGILVRTTKTGRGRLDSKRVGSALLMSVGHLAGDLRSGKIPPGMVVFFLFMWILWLDSVFLWQLLISSCLYGREPEVKVSVLVISILKIIYGLFLHNTSNALLRVVFMIDSSYGSSIQSLFE